MRTFVVAVFILALFSVPVGPDEAPTPAKLPTTVAAMVDTLEKNDNALGYAWTVAYIWGVDAGLYVGHPCYMGPLTGANVNNKKMADIFLTFANKHRDKWEKTNAIHHIAAGALLEAFPCDSGRELKL